MQVRRWFDAEVWRLGPIHWALVVATFVSVFTFVTTPWLSLAACGTMIAAVIYIARQEGRTISLRPVPNWLIAGGIGAVYILLSTVWSGDPRSTALSGIILALLLAGVHITARALVVVSVETLAHMTRTMMVAVLFALLFLLIEEVADHATKRGLSWPFRVLRWRDGGLAIDWAVAPMKISSAGIKWSMPPLDFLLWPALAICWLQLGARQARLPQLAIAGAAFLLIVLSDHRTSQVAFVLATVTFAVASRFPVFVRRSLMALWGLSFVAIIPLAQAAYDAKLHLGGRVGPTMAARIILWNHTAGEVSKQPIAGVGAAATRLIDNQREALSPAPKPEGYFYQLRTGPHAHDVFLQSWYELGALGTVLFAAFGLCVIAALAGAPRDTQPYLLAAATTVYVTSAASFGLFEPWFMGAFAMCALVSSAVLAYRRRLE